MRPAPFAPSSLLARVAVLAAALLLPAGAALAAEVAAPSGVVSIVNTPPPGGFLGLNGFDVFSEQAVAARFTVPADGDMRLARIGLWLMNNSDTLQKTVHLSLETDALDEGGTLTQPSGRVLEKWSAPVATLGWDPVEQFFTTTKGPRLAAGRSYWVVAKSKSAPFVDPVWTFASKGTMVTTTSQNGAWQTAGNGGALTLQVDAKPVATAP